MVSLIRNMVGKHSRRGGCRAEAAKRFDEDHWCQASSNVLDMGGRWRGDRAGERQRLLRRGLMRLTHGKLAQGKRFAELAGSVADAPSIISDRVQLMSFVRC